MALKGILKSGKAKSKVQVSFKEESEDESDWTSDHDADSEMDDADDESKDDSVKASEDTKKKRVGQTINNNSSKSPTNDSNIDDDSDVDADEYDIDNVSDVDSVPDLDNFDADDDDSERGDDFGNVGWADALMKVLKTNAPKKKKQLILSRGLTDEEAAKKKEKKSAPEANIEVVDSEGRPVKRLSEVEDAGSAKKKLKNELDKEKAVGKQNRLAREKWEKIARVKPSPDDLLRERTLSSIATKGVVQLFNAVKEQQKVVAEKLKKTKKLDSSRDEILTQMADEDKFLEKVRSAPAPSKSSLNKQSPGSELLDQMEAEEISNSESNIKSKPAKKSKESPNSNKTKSKSSKVKTTRGKWKVLDDNFMLEQRDDS